MSLPLKPSNGNKNILFPSASSLVFIYQNGYVAVDTLQNGKGFWVKFDSSETIPVTGDIVLYDTIQVQAEWNLIGSLSAPTAINTIQTVPAGIISLYYFGYVPGSGYQATDTLQPGKGYWIKVNQNGLLILSSVGPCAGTPTLTYGGTTYNTIQIGTQCWLKENLEVGTMIAGSSDQTNNSIIEKYCFNNNTSNCTTYGAFYQWDEAMQYSTTEGAQGICPAGWHIPTYAEFHTLGTSVANDGNALQAVGQGTGTNTSGFSALLAGFRNDNGSIYYLGSKAYFWSSTENNATAANFFALIADDSNIYYYPAIKIYGFSVRCLKNETPQTPSLLSPADGATEISLPPTLIWNASISATSYTLQVSTDSLFANLMYNQSGLTDTTHQVSGLNNLTKYYWRVNASNSRDTSVWSAWWSFTTISNCGSTITYGDKTYNTVLIGTQCWFKENLDVGTMIAGITNQTNNDTIEKYCYNDAVANCNTYGGLYQWDEVMQYATTEGAQGICPAGWHIPTYAGLQTLRTSVANDGNALKAVGQGTGTNTSGFSALLSGHRSYDGYFSYLGYNSYFWSSTEYDGTYAFNLFLYYAENGIFFSDGSKGTGFSVRCLKN